MIKNIVENIESVEESVGSKTGLEMQKSVNAIKRNLLYLRKNSKIFRELTQDESGFLKNVKTIEKVLPELQAQVQAYNDMKSSGWTGAI